MTLFLGACAALVAAAAQGQTVRVSGEVVMEGGGGGVSGVTVFAVDERTRNVSGWATSGAQGRFVVHVPGGANRFSAVAADYTMVRVEKLRRGKLRIVVQLQGQPHATPSASLSVRGHGESLEVVGGRVVDETGVGLSGVRLMLITSQGQRVAMVSTSAGGTFEAAVAPGPHDLLVFAPGLQLQDLAETGRNRWTITLAVAGGVETVRIEADGPGDPDNPDARERARLTFRGAKVSALPRVSPTLADLQIERAGSAHPVARQPLGGFCIRSAHCDQRTGQTVCCAQNGDLTDEYSGGIGGACKPASGCTGARRYRRPATEASR